EVKKVDLFGFMLLLFKIKNILIVSSFDVMFEIFPQNLKQPPGSRINGRFGIDFFSSLQPLILAGASEVMFFRPLLIDDMGEFTLQVPGIFSFLFKPVPELVAFEQDFRSAVRKMAPPV